MAVTANWYGNGLLGMFSTTAARRVDWVTDTIKVALTTVTYVPDPDVDTFFSTVTNEVSSTNYTAGGLALGTKSTSYNAATNETRLIAAASVWTTVTFTARIAVIYKDTGVAATSPLLGWSDFGGNQSVSGANFTITWDATFGLLKITS